MITDVEHLFLYLLAFYMSILKNVYSGPLSILKLGYPAETPFRPAYAAAVSALPPSF